MVHRHTNWWYTLNWLVMHFMKKKINYRRLFTKKTMRKTHTSKLASGCETFLYETKMLPVRKTLFSDRELFLLTRSDMSYFSDLLSYDKYSTKKWSCYHKCGIVEISPYGLWNDCGAKKDY